MIKQIVTSLIVSILVVLGFLAWNAYQFKAPHKGLMATPANRTSMVSEINGTIYTNGIGLITAAATNTLLQDFLSGVTAFMGDNPVVLPNPVQMNSSLAMGGATITPPASGSSHFQWPTADGTNGQVLTSLGSPVTAWQTPSVTGPPLMGYINGLWMGATGTNVFTISKGVAADSTDSVLMSYAGGSKQLSSPFTAGNSQGGLDTGTVANNTWYHVYLISNANASSVDILISLSASSPTMPAGFTKFRRIGSILSTVGSIARFTQIGNDFFWTTPYLDVNNSAVPTVPIDPVLTHIPLGVDCLAKFSATLTNATTQTIAMYSLVTGTSGTSGANFSNIGGAIAAANFEIMTNTEGKIEVSNTNTGTTLTITTYGWTDQRGSQ